MRLTTKGRYAVTAMLDIALHRKDGPVSLQHISARQSISRSYLEQLFAKLKKQALVTSNRGPGGGYSLARPVSEIFVADIIDAVDEKVDATHCHGKGNCHNGAVCLTHYLWSDLSSEIYRFLSDVSLEKLLARKDVQAISKEQEMQQKAQSMVVDDLLSPLTPTNESAR